MATGPDTDALQSALRQAVLENDPARIEELLDGQTLDEDFRLELIGGIVAAGDHAALVKRLVQDAGENITPTALVTFLSSAARQAHSETAAYLVNQCTAADIPRSDCVSRVAQNTPSYKIGEMATRIAADTDDSKQTLADFMLFVTTAKKFDALAELADAGATMRGHSSIILMMALNAQTEEFADGEQKPAYNDLMDKLINRACDDKDALDLLLPLVAYKVPDGMTDPAFMESVTKAGADPFYMGAEARRFLIQAYTQKDKPQTADQWQNWFDDRQREYTNAQRHQFDTLFGQDFRVQDLLRTETENGENGLMLAARARRIPELMRAAEKTGDLDVAALLQENAHKQSLLTLAIDRGDAAALLKPSYWSAKGVDMLSVLDKHLSDDQKKWIDMDGICAQIDHHMLQKMAQNWQPPQRLRPRSGA